MIPVTVRRWVVEVTINGQSQAVEQGITVAGLLSRLDVQAGPAAVEVNGEVISRRRHAEHVLRPGDRIEVVTLAGGG